MSKLLEGLNPKQYEAAAVMDGAVLVLAGAGSGKTRVLTRRIAHLVERGVPPWQILSVTFTNKAAAEMKERVAHLMADPDKARRVMVSTFHSACVRFLREDIQELGYSKQFTIFDDDDQRALLKQIAEDLRVSKEVNLYEVRSAIDRAKNSLLSPEDLANDKGIPPGDPTPAIYAAYQQRMFAASAVDFNDIINLVVKLWEEHPAVLAKYRNRFRYLLVDEYQDTNRAQFRLIELLTAGLDHGNVMVVGDDDQSIYGFRGADIRNILDFQKTFPHAQVIRLEQNYRSRGNILRAANAVVKNNRERMDKTLWTDQAPGEPLAMLVGQDEAEEAELIKERMLRFGRDGRRWGEMAIIYRTNAASRAFEQAMTQARIPYVLVGAKKFYQRKEVKDLISYLKLMLNPADPMAFERVVNTPRRGVGPKLMDELREAANQAGVPMLEAARRLSASSSGRGMAALREFVGLIDRLRERMLVLQPSELVSVVLRESGYNEYLRNDDPERADDRLRNVEELATAIAEEADQTATDEAGGPLARLQEFLDRASLAGQADELPDEDERGRVTLLTAHLAKGLEYPIVFVVGMQEGGFPHYRARDLERDIEEERRLVYVAFTRAMEHLTLSRARRRLVPGRGFENTEPSRFLNEVPRDLLRLGGDLGIARAPVQPEVDRAARMARLGLAMGGAQAPAPGAARPTPAQPRFPSMSAPPAGAARPAAAAPPAGAHRTRTPEGIEDFGVGVRVLHGTFGAGTIRKREGSASNLKITVHFDAIGPKVLFALRANLELLDE